MDFPLCDPLDGQGDLISYNAEDHGHTDFVFYNCDTIEEDALNEKSCVQVLRILIEKADEDIIKLEEDILMLECQLALDDEDWSKLCSVVLRNRIAQLDGLIPSSKNEFRDVHKFYVELKEPCKLIPRLHDLVKPLLEKYFLVKSKQAESQNMMVSTLHSGEPGKMKMAAKTSKPNNNLEANERTNQSRKSLPMEPKERKINCPKQKPSAKKAAMKNSEEKRTLSNLKSESYLKKSAERISTPVLMLVENAETGIHKKEGIISNSIENPHQYTIDKFSEKDTDKLNRKTGKETPKSAPSKTGKRSLIFEEQSKSVVNDSNPSSIGKTGARWGGMMRNTEVTSRARVHQFQLAQEIKVTDSYLQSHDMGLKISKAVQPADVILDSRTIHGKDVSEEFTATSEKRAYRHAINKDLEAKKPLHKKRKMTKFPESTETLKTLSTETTDSDSDLHLELFNLKRKNPSMPKKKTKDKQKVQQKLEMENIVINLDNPTHPVKHVEKQLEKARVRAQEIAPNMCTPEGIDLDSSSREILKGQQKNTATVMIGKNSSKETQQESSWTEKDDASEVTLTSVSS